MRQSAGRQRVSARHSKRPSPASSVQTGSARPMTELRGNGSKVPTVHAVRRIPVHEEEFAVGDTAAALPDRQLATGAVADAGAADRRAVGENVETIAADGLPRERKNAFQERHALRQIPACGEKRGEFGRRRDDDEIRHLEVVGRLHGIEADRRAGAGVPEQWLRQVDRPRTCQGRRLRSTWPRS